MTWRWGRPALLQIPAVRTVKDRTALDRTFWAIGGHIGAKMRNLNVLFIAMTECGAGRYRQHLAWKGRFASSSLTFPGMRRRCAVCLGSSLFQAEARATPPRRPQGQSTRVARKSEAKGDKDGRALTRRDTVQVRRRACVYRLRK